MVKPVKELGHQQLTHSPNTNAVKNIIKNRTVFKIVDSISNQAVHNKNDNKNMKTVERHISRKNTFQDRFRSAETGCLHAQRRKVRIRQNVHTLQVKNLKRR